MQSPEHAQPSDAWRTATPGSGLDGQERDDLSVRLEWPVDSLTSSPADGDKQDASTRLAGQLDALEASADSASTEAVIDALRTMNEALLRVIDENMNALDERLTGLRTAMMAMLASRQAEEERTQRREREAILARVEEALAAVPAELQALRRRIPITRKNASSMDEDAMEDLVNRFADEVEIRIAAALKPKPRRKP